MKSTPTVIEAALECPLLTRARAVAAFVDLGTGRVRQAPAPPVTWADDDMLELRIDLDRFRPPVWRRVRLHAATPLTELHEIIQVLFDWDGDHMHVFTVDGNAGGRVRG